MVSLCSRNHIRLCGENSKIQNIGISSETQHREFPGSTVVRLPCLHCQGSKFHSWQGNQIPDAMQHSQNTHTTKNTKKPNKNQNTIWPVSETYTNENQQFKKKSEMKKIRKSHKKYPQQEIQCESHKTKCTFTRKPELSVGSELR